MAGAGVAARGAGAGVVMAGVAAGAVYCTVPSGVWTGVVTGVQFSTRQGDVEAGFLVLLAKDTVLKGVERQDLPKELYHRLIPGPPKQGANVLDTPDRVVVDDQLQGRGVVRVEEKRQPIGHRPGVELDPFHPRQFVQVGDELGGLRLELGVVDIAVLDGGGEHLSQTRVRRIERGRPANGREQPPGEEIPEEER